MFVHHKMSLEKSKTHGKGNKNYKTLSCERFAAGICEYGQECWFIHDPSALTLLKPPSEISLDASVNSDGTTTRVGSPPPPPASTPTKITTPLSARAKAHPCYKTQPCYAFKRAGKCERGDNCTFRHDEDFPLKTPSQSPGHQTPTHHRSNSAGKQPCFDLLRTGKCPKGEACIFSHESPGRHIKWYRGVTCKLWLAGNCKHGDTCLFKHADPSPSPTVDPRDQLPGLRISTLERSISVRHEASPAPTFGDNIFARACTPIQDSRNALYQMHSPIKTYADHPLHLTCDLSLMRGVNHRHHVWDTLKHPSRDDESSSSSSFTPEEVVSPPNTVDLTQIRGLTLGEPEDALIAQEYLKTQMVRRKERENRVSALQDAEDDVIYQR